MISSTLQILAVIGVILLLLFLLWPQTLILHFDNKRLFIRYSLGLKAWQGERKTGFILSHILRFVYKIVPPEVVSAIFQAPLKVLNSIKHIWGKLPFHKKRKRGEEDTAPHQQHSEQDVDESKISQTKEEQAEIPAISQKSITEDQEKETETVTSEESRAVNEKQITVAQKEAAAEEKESSHIEEKQPEEKADTSSGLHDNEPEEGDEDETLRELLTRIWGYWQQEKKFVGKVYRWLKRTLKIGVRLIIPSRIWLHVEGGVEDPKETADIWVWSTSINAFFKEVMPVFDCAFVPQFTLKKKWIISGEIVFRFNVLRFIMALFIVLVTLPYISALRFYLRWRPKKEPLQN